MNVAIKLQCQCHLLLDLLYINSVQICLFIQLMYQMIYLSQIFKT